MRTVHCDIWENSLTCFADDLLVGVDDDQGVDFAFADHDVDSFDYTEPEADNYGEELV